MKKADAVSAFCLEAISLGWGGDQYFAKIGPPNL